VGAFGESREVECVGLRPEDLQAAVPTGDLELGRGLIRKNDLERRSCMCLGTQGPGQDSLGMWGGAVQTSRDRG
jgi:hypothetical protein